MKKVKVFIACDTDNPKKINYIIKKSFHRKISLGLKNLKRLLMSLNT